MPTSAIASVPMNDGEALQAFGKIFSAVKKKEGDWRVGVFTSQTLGSRTAAKDFSQYLEEAQRKLAGDPAVVRPEQIEACVKMYSAIAAKKSGSDIESFMAKVVGRDDAQRLLLFLENRRRSGN